MHYSFKKEQHEIVRSVAAQSRCALLQTRFAFMRRQSVITAFSVCGNFCDVCCQTLYSFFGFASDESCDSRGLPSQKLSIVLFSSCIGLFFSE